MLAKVTSCAVVGLEGALVEVEVDISAGLPSFTIVGFACDNTASSCAGNSNLESGTTTGGRSQPHPKYVKVNLVERSYNDMTHLILTC